MKSQKAEEGGAKSRKTAASISEREPAVLEEGGKQGDAANSSKTQGGKPGESDASRLAATGGLATILGQLVAYFNGRADIDDMDVLSFSLHHLFCRVDFLYRKALPALTESTTLAVPVAQAMPADQVRQAPARQAQSNPLPWRQRIWLQLQAINRTLDRMEPLCHLLSDATECMLDSFDQTSEILTLAENGEPLALPVAAQPDQGSEVEGYLQGMPLLMVDQQRWDQAFNAVTQSLLAWQKQHQALIPFAVQFASVAATTPTVVELDAAFATILDSAGAIFGDILPGFRTILAGEGVDAAVAALLFDLMQQSDQLLIQFDTTLEPLNALIRHYSLGFEGG